MPIDTSIYGQQTPPQGFNTPFQALAQIGSLQRIQQQVAEGKALEDERKQRLADQQRKDQEAATFNSIIGNPAITRDSLLEQIRTKAPEHYLGALKSFQDLDKSAEEYQKAKNESDAAAALAQQRQQAVIGTVANGIAAHNYAPAAFEAGLKELEQRFPAFAPTAASYRQLALQNGPDWIKEHVDGLRSMADREKAAELPGKQAASDLAQQVTDNSYGGMTPTQQSEADNREEARKQEAQRIAVEQARLKIEQDKAKEAAGQKAKGKQLPASEADKISDLDKGLSALRDLRESIATGTTGTAARIGAAIVPNMLDSVIPGVASAKATQADIVRAQQVVGRLIHGGVMRANDAAAAAKYMPQLGDSSEVIKRKLDDAEKAGIETRTNHLGNLGKSGYDVSNFSLDTTPAAEAPKATLAAGRVQRVVQDGVTYEVTTDPQGKIISSKPVQ